MAYTQLKRTHISVDLLTSRLNKRVRITLEIINGFILVSLSALVAYHMFLYALKLLHTETVSPTLQIPLHFFVFGLALSFLSLGIVTFWQLLHSFKGFKK
jgi:TRAP-type C4-dicarboxylate transport system permease small subunit